MAEEIISPGQDTWPNDVFLLPICTTPQRLARMLSALHVGGKYLPLTDELPESGANVIPDEDELYDPHFNNVQRFDHLTDVLEALGHIASPTDAFCFTASLPPESTCQSYAPSAGFIDWFPNNPFLNPDFVGAGYANPAWYLATTASNIAYGSQNGDVITSIDRFPPGSLPDVLPASGLPRFRINVSGTGTVKATLVNMFGGSLIQTTVDDNPLSVKFVDVARDTIALPPETQTEITVSFDFDTPGAHWVDFIVISWVNSSVPFLHHGAGLRSIDLCGFTDMPVITPPFRFTADCGLEYYNGEDWLSVAGWTDFAPACFTGPPGTNGSDAPATIVRTDPAGFGNMEQSIGAAAFTDIANSDFLRRGGEFPMYGGLEIEGVANEIKLAVRAAGTQTAKLAVFKNAANVENAWILPDGGAEFHEHITIDVPDSDVIMIYRAGSLQGKIESPLFYPMLSSNHRLGLRNSGATGGFLLMETTGRVVIKPGALTAIAEWFSRVQIEMLAGDENGLRVNTNGALGNLAMLYASANNQTQVDYVAQLHQNRQIMFYRNSSTVWTQVGRMLFDWDDNTHATRKPYASLTLTDNAGEREILRGATTGSAPKLGVLGATPSARVDVGVIDCLGNAGTKAALDALKTFGWIAGTINLGVPNTDPPVAGLCELTRCQLAQVTGGWFATQVFGVAAYWAGRYDENMLQSERFDKVIAYTDVHFANQDTLGDWVNEIYLAYGIFDASDTDLNAFQIEAQNHIKNVVVPLIFCYMNDCGYMNTQQWDGFIASLPNTAGAAHWVRDLFRSIDHYGLAAITALARQSSYVDGALDDCSSFDCENWQVTMNFLADDWANSVNLIEGVYSTVYASIVGADQHITIQIPFAVTSAAITVYNQYSTPNDALYVREIGGTAYTFFDPPLGQSTWNWTGNFPNGIEISFGNSGSGIDRFSEIRSVTLSGTGIAPAHD